MRIAIAGIGGVGGFFGGLLAKCYYSGPTEIIFIARGENEKVIRSNGLLLESVDGKVLIHPRFVTSEPSEVAPVDLLLCCTKGYDLEDAMRQCSPIINEQTVILPLLNGVDASERIKSVLPRNEVWSGCVYLVSHLAEPGLVRETGNIRKLFFGSDHGSPEKLGAVHKIFLDAGIDAILSENIQETVWEKFLFISPIATLTAYLDKTIAEIFSEEANEKLLLNLIDEINGVALRKGIRLPDDTTFKNIDRMRSLPKGTTSSMHRDFRKGGRTEVESLTGYVVRSGRLLSVPVPSYELMYESLIR